MAGFPIAPPGFQFPYTVDPGIIRGIDQIIDAANQGIYMRSLYGGTISAIGLTVVISSGNISLAIYRNNGSGRNATPTGGLLAATGSIACPAGGYAEVPISQATLLPGDWFALAADNATASFRSLLANPIDNDLGKGRQFRQLTAFPLPAVPSSLIATIGWTYCLVGV